MTIIFYCEFFLYTALFGILSQHVVSIYVL